MRLDCRSLAMMSPSKESDTEADVTNADMPENRDVGVNRLEEGDQLDGHVATDPEDTKLPHSVLDVDMDVIDEGMLVDAAFNSNVGSFLPSQVFESMVKDYKNAQKLFGPTLIRELSGYDPRYVDKNIRIPEFQRELQKKLRDRFDELVDKGVLNKGGGVSDHALDIATLFLIDEEFKTKDHESSSFGEHVHFSHDKTGHRSTVRAYNNSDPFRDIAIRASITRSIKRGHVKIHPGDLHAYDRESRQQVNVVYALDTSGSMKGEKMRMAKKAGVSLAYRAIRDHNKTGLVLFGSSVEKRVFLTNDFWSFVRPLAQCTPSQETDLALAVEAAHRLLDDAKGIKHIVLITDGLHTRSDDSRVVLDQVSIATSDNISISVVGINFDEQGLQLARTIVDISGGNLYSVKNADEVGGIVIGDYASLL